MTWLKSGRYLQINSYIFIACLSIKNLSYRAICLYIIAMSYHHKIVGASNNTRHFIVTKSVEGVRRSVSVNKDIRLPKIIHSFISVCRSPYELSILAATYTVTIFGLLRVREVLALQANHNLSKSVRSIFHYYQLMKDRPNRQELGCGNLTATPNSFLSVINNHSKLDPPPHPPPHPRKPTLFVHIDSKSVIQYQLQ